jgi:hypothetical protein
VTAFNDELTGAIEPRVAEVVAGVAEGIDVDIVQLQREQRDRATWLVKRVTRDPGTDWERVRKGFDVIRGATNRLD